MPAPRLLSPLLLATTLVVAMGGPQPTGGWQPSGDVVARSQAGQGVRGPEASPGREREVTGRTFALVAARTAGGRRLRVVPGVPDARGCRSLSVRRGRKVVLRIPSHQTNCSTNRRQMRIGGYLYFDWGVTKRRSGERQRRTDLWVSDGTRSGTVRLTTLRSGTFRRMACAARWERVGGISVAGAQWCWHARSGDYVSGDIRIHTQGRFMRTSPVPRMQQFAVAGRRMVTTGEGNGGRELWLHDSQMVGLDLRPGPRGSNPRDFRQHGRRKVRFIANDGTGKALWVTDGTIAGTRKVRR